MKAFLKRLTSRKFLTAMAGFVMGLSAYLSLDQNEIGQVAGLVVSAISAVTYIITEGTVDAKAVEATKEVKSNE